MVSDQVAITIATGLFTLIGTIFTGLMTYFLARLNKKADNAAAKAEEVKTALNNVQEMTEQKLSQTELKVAKNSELLERNRQTISKSTAVVASKIDEIKDVGEKTHKLVNGAMLAQLKATMDALKKVAELTKEPMDIEAARIAEESYAGHAESPLNPNKQTL